MSSARKFFIFLVIFLVAGVIQLHAQQESSCYVAVSVEDDDKEASSRDEEILSVVPKAHTASRDEVVRRRPVAQLEEHRSPKPGVGGSSPSWPASFWFSVCVYDVK